MQHYFATLMRHIRPLEIVALIIMVSACTFASFLASKILSLNPDALVSVYMFQDNLALRDIFVADWHTNVLKFPLLWLQAHLPFTPLTFMIFNTGLLIVSIGGWAAASCLIFGRKYFGPIIIMISGLCLASVNLPGEIAFTTIRNIEYPLYFMLLIFFWKLIALHQSSQQTTSRLWLLSAIYIVAMSILMASDPFFTYISVPALLIIGSIVAWQQKYSARLVTIGLGLLLLPVAIAKMLIMAMQYIGIFQYFGEQLHPPFRSLPQLPQAIWQSIGDFLILVDADIFGFKLTHLGLNNYLLFGICVVLALGYGAALCRLPAYLKKQPAFATLLLGTVFLSASYVGVTGLEHQYRYLVLLLFTMVLATAVWLYQPIARIRLGVPYRIVAIMVSAITLGGLCYGQYERYNFYHFAQDRAALLEVTDTLKAQQVTTIITGHTYSSLLKFWSGNELAIAPVLYCNQNLPFLTRASWYKPTPGASGLVALIVDRQGRDAHSWNCSTNALLEYYGPPLSHVAIAGLGNTTLDVYTYPQEILSKIQIITTPGKPIPRLN